MLVDGQELIQSSGKSTTLKVKKIVDTILAAGPKNKRKGRWHYPKGMGPMSEKVEDMIDGLCDRLSYYPVEFKFFAPKLLRSGKIRHKLWVDVKKGTEDKIK